MQLLEAQISAIYQFYYDWVLKSKSKKQPKKIVLARFLILVVLIPIPGISQIAFDFGGGPYAAIGDFG